MWETLKSILICKKLTKYPNQGVLQLQAEVFFFPPIFYCCVDSEHPKRDLSVWGVEAKAMGIME
jgi:hypothetical protein